ncbi:hypothetical protein RclHR1_32780001 [Rhizophagus clarus]|uniref:Uncharacterized protein n=1 Tax=Rhizophagus clarus TaxID=94130 RepID=A0A2Z6R8T3_9GLOM|nr:hypothetical protein RclHR1_32780001 [Rhizophagus clarus]
MDKNPPQDNRFIEFNNLQQSTAAVIQSGHEHSSNIDYNAVNVNVDHYAMMNDNNILPPYTNINHFNQQSNISTSQSYPPHHMRHSILRSRLKIPLFHLVLLILLNLESIVLIFLGLN